LTDELDTHHLEGKTLVDIGKVHGDGRIQLSGSDGDEDPKPKDEKPKKGGAARKNSGSGGSDDEKPKKGGRKGSDGSDEGEKDDEDGGRKGSDEGGEGDRGSDDEPKETKKKKDEPKKKPLSQRGYEDHKALLTKGAMFVKYKYMMGKQRMIWCGPALDRIHWGDEKKKDVKGFILTTELVGVKPGAKGSRKQDQAFTIVTTQRTLQLEADSVNRKEEWMAAINWLADPRNGFTNA